MRDNCLLLAFGVIILLIATGMAGQQPWDEIENEQLAFLMAVAEQELGAAEIQGKLIIDVICTLLSVI